MKRPLHSPVLLVIAGLALSGCIRSVQQDLSRSLALSPGLSKQQVLQVMGTPVKTEFSRGVEEWHYCRTGTGVDQFLALFFQEGALIESKNYSVTIRDAGGATGSCENFIKMGNYREPDRVTEIRLKVR